MITIRSLILLIYRHVSYYGGSFPLYDKRDEVLKPSEVFEAILNTDPSSEVVCKQKPVGICDSGVFLMDLTKLKHPKDIKADEIGSWIHKGKPIRYFDVEQSENGEVLMASRTDKDDDSGSVYKLTRIYYHNKATPQFRKTLFYTGDLIPGKPCNNIDKDLIKTFLSCLFKRDRMLCTLYVTSLISTHDITENTLQSTEKHHVLSIT